MTKPAKAPVTTPSKRGGARPGTGPKPSGVKRRHVQLTDAEAQYAESIGDGNVSKGVRTALNEHKKAHTN